MCALCVILCHVLMVWYSEATRKPLRGNLAPLETNESPDYRPGRKVRRRSDYPRRAHYIQRIETPLVSLPLPGTIPR